MNDHITELLLQTWRHGYQAAIHALRELADAHPDPSIKLQLTAAADRLEAVKPWGKNQ